MNMNLRSLFLSISISLLGHYTGYAYFRNIKLMCMVGEEYDSGSSRDWAVKGPMLLVDAVAKLYKFDKKRGEENNQHISERGKQRRREYLQTSGTIKWLALSVVMLWTVGLREMESSVLC
jgi:hypothetical protein